MNMIMEAADNTRKYRVHSNLGAWIVSLDQRPLDSFSDAIDAAEAACRRARKDAHDGSVAIVSVETSPRELHCFTPEPSRTKPAASRTAPYLRLLPGR